jgi:hypothetical protein
MTGRILLIAAALVVALANYAGTRIIEVAAVRLVCGDGPHWPGGFRNVSKSFESR